MEKIVIGRTGLEVYRLGFGGIPLQRASETQAVLGIRSMVKRMGEGILQKGRHREAIDKARSCTACEVCKDRCPYQLPIPDLIEENLQWVDEQLKSSGSLPG